MGVNESVSGIITCSMNERKPWAGSDMQRAGQKLLCRNKAVLARSNVQAAVVWRISLFSVQQPDNRL